ncbi:MAG: tryptophan-rich sensory protein [Opitutales bacterium]|nr:tryptophan-rich sensory protein [Opitutales bacterium]
MQATETADRLKWIFRTIWIVALLLLGSFLTSLFVSSGPDSWYAGLDKVPWTPPSWVFSPVWISLYILMGISFSLQWRQGFETPLKRAALWAFVIQLILNFSYTPVQFGLQWLFGQAVVILLLLGSLILWFRLLLRIHWFAGIMQLPYLIWVAYASTVAVGFWWLNS